MKCFGLNSKQRVSANCRLQAVSFYQGRSLKAFGFSTAINCGNGGKVFRKIRIESSLVVQRVKDPASSLQQLRSLLWHWLDPAWERPYAAGVKKQTNKQTNIQTKKTPLDLFSSSSSQQGSVNPHLRVPGHYGYYGLRLPNQSGGYTVTQPAKPWVLLLFNLRSSNQMLTFLRLKHQI